jgi:DNA polymerase (family X)
MTNAEINAVLLDIAALLKWKKDNIFKVRAYEKAASSIEALTVPLEQLVREHKLREVPGIGPAIEKKITELVTTGRLEYYEKLKAEQRAAEAASHAKIGDGGASGVEGGSVP